MSIFEEMLSRVGRPYTILMSPQAYNDLLELQKWENWVKGLGPRKEKQERLKRKLLSKKKLNKLPLPN